MAKQTDRLQQATLSRKRDEAKYFYGSMSDEESLAYLHGWFSGYRVAQRNARKRKKEKKA